MKRTVREGQKEMKILAGDSEKLFTPSVNKSWNLRVEFEKIFCLRKVISWKVTKWPHFNEKKFENEF